MMVLKGSLRSLAAGRDAAAAAAADTKVLLGSQLLHPVKHVFEFQSRVRKEVTSRNTIRELISAPRLSYGSVRNCAATERCESICYKKNICLTGRNMTDVFVLLHIMCFYVTVSEQRDIFRLLFNIWKPPVAPFICACPVYIEPISCEGGRWIEPIIRLQNLNISVIISVSVMRSKSLSES